MVVRFFWNFYRRIFMREFAGPALSGGLGCAVVFLGIGEERDRSGSRAKRVGTRRSVTELRVGRASALAIKSVEDMRLPCFRPSPLLLMMHGAVGLIKPLHLDRRPRAWVTILEDEPSEAYETTLHSEAGLAEDWNRTEEDAAWSHLEQVPEFSFRWRARICRRPSAVRGCARQCGAR